MSCNDGTCACPSGKIECDGTCVDTPKDEDNCGSCGNKCPSFMSCEGGNCSFTPFDLLIIIDSYEECSFLSVIFLILRDLAIIWLVFICIRLSNRGKL